jgi:Lrp/AsnC family transcriptional regulator for asnA, asnC and gidA
MVEDSSRKELDQLDKNILYHLDIDSRQSVSKIAKKVGSNRNTVDSRIKRLKDSGIISCFSTAVSFSRLGFQGVEVFLQLHDVDRDVEKRFYEHLDSTRQVGKIFTYGGRWNFSFSVRTRSARESNDIIRKVLSGYDKYIQYKEVVHNIDIFLCDRSWLLEDPPQPVCVNICGSASSIELDDVDKGILKLLIEDARMPVVDISKKTGQSSQNVIYRIRRLEKNKVIAKHFLFIDHSRIGCMLCRVLVYLQKTTADSIKEVLSYCSTLPNILEMLVTLGPWDLALTFEAENFDQVLSAMHDIQQRFSDLIKSYDPIVITRRSVIKLPEE